MGNAFQAAFGAARLWVGETMGVEVCELAFRLPCVDGQPENIGRILTGLRGFFRLPLRYGGIYFVYSGVGGGCGQPEKWCDRVSGCLWRGLSCSSLKTVDWAMVVDSLKKVGQRKRGTRRNA